MSFSLSNYEAGRDLERLDGGAFDVRNLSSRIVGYVSDHRSRKLRVVRVTFTGKRGAEWQATDEKGSFYLAGPMRGYPLSNFPAFLMAARILTSRGFEIVSPAEKDIEAGFDPSLPAEDQKFDLGAAFAWDFAAVCRTQGTILMPGWENSVGAKAERLVAQLSGKEVYLLKQDYTLVEAPAADYELTWKPQSAPVVGC